MDLTLAFALAVSIAGADKEPACVGSARAWVKKIEALPMRRRASAIELALRRDPGIVCGVIEQAFFARAPETPAGCDPARPVACVFPKGLEVADRLKEDSDPTLYLRVQIIATRLRERGLFSEAHERLLSTLLLAAALAREEHHD